jgi:hypothetical protein
VIGAKQRAKVAAAVVACAGVAHVVWFGLAWQRYAAWLGQSESPSYMPSARSLYWPAPAVMCGLVFAAHVAAALGLRRSWSWARSLALGLGIAGALFAVAPYADVDVTRPPPIWLALLALAAAVAAVSVPPASVSAPLATRAAALFAPILLFLPVVLDDQSYDFVPSWDHWLCAGAALGMLAAAAAGQRWQRPRLFALAGAVPVLLLGRRLWAVRDELPLLDQPYIGGAIELLVLLAAVAPVAAAWLAARQEKRETSPAAMAVIAVSLLAAVAAVGVYSWRRSVRDDCRQSCTRPYKVGYREADSAARDCASGCRDATCGAACRKTSRARFDAVRVAQARCMRACE